MPETQTTNPPTFGSVWALIQEVGEKQKEYAGETFYITAPKDKPKEW